MAWLMLALGVAVAHPWVPESTWLLTHLVLLGALTHSVMVWSTHFAATVLKSPPSLDERRIQSRRLLLLLLGTSLVLLGVPSDRWPLTAAGAVTVSTAVGWHLVQLVRRLRHALPGRFRIVVRYYIAAAGCLPVGATFGVLLAREPADPWHGQLLLAHVSAMALGWLGLTVTGTLITLWPTMLRTRMDDRAERFARQALPLLVGALVVTVTGALTDLPAMVALGLLLWLGGLLWTLRAAVRPLRARPPREFAPASVGIGLLWLTGGVLTLAATVLPMHDLAGVTGLSARVATVVAAGFGLQVLTGALSHLVPSVLGGGPSVVRAGQRWLERWAVLRLTVINGGLAVTLLPVVPAVRLAAAALALTAFAVFVPLLLRGIAAAVAARRAMAAGEPLESPAARPWTAGQFTAALAVLALAVSLGTAVSGSAATDLAAGVTPTGHTTTVRVTAHGMRYEPAIITVPAGDRLVIELTNTDDTETHDLTLPNGLHTPRLAPGRSATLDAGVIGRSTQGWCSVIGHRRMGMVLDIHVNGTHPVVPTDRTGGPSMGTTTAYSQAAVDPRLPPVPAGRVHRVSLVIADTTLEVAPGVWQKRWTFNGQAPGPVLHGRVGDRFVVTVRNSAPMTHSIDFHAGEVDPARAMRAIPPGTSHIYRFTAARAGIWMYHCSTMPMSTHIAAGLFGAVVIDPPALPPVDREWVLLGSETYLGVATTQADASEVDDAAVAAEQPDLMSFNARADQYDATPLRARVGDRVRIWVLDAGPSRPLSFHVVGEPFDAVWTEGAWTLPPGTTGGAQVLPLLPAEGGFVDLTFGRAGAFPFVNHVMVDSERGEHGLIQVGR